MVIYFNAFKLKSITLTIIFLVGLFSFLILGLFFLFGVIVGIVLDVVHLVVFFSNFFVRLAVVLILNLVLIAVLVVLFLVPACGTGLDRFAWFRLEWLGSLSDGRWKSLRWRAYRTRMSILRYQSRSRQSS